MRGFGFLHDGSIDTLFRFHASTVFVERPPTNLFPNPGGIPVASPTDDPATAQQKVLANIQLQRQSRRSCSRSIRTWRPSSVSR